MHLKHLKKNRIINIKGGLAKTGQVISYYPKDDGDYQRGLPVQGEKFIDNGDGTIKDLVTGLMWVKDPSQIPGGLFGTPGSPITMGWYDAIDNCENLDYAGYSDWRLPNIREFASIVDCSKYNPAIDTAYFPNTQTSGYWASTTLLAYDSYAWMTYLYYGYQTFGSKNYGSYYVRPVRAGR